MDYTTEQLQRIEELAHILTPASEISALLGLKNEDEFQLDIATKGNPARTAFMRGMAQTAHDLRSKNLELANACAPSAIEQCFHDLKHMMNDLERV